MTLNKELNKQIYSTELEDTIKWLTIVLIKL